MSVLESDELGVHRHDVNLSFVLSLTESGRRAKDGRFTSSLINFGQQYIMVTNIMTPRLFLLVCLAASPSITAFKSTSIQQSVGSSINNNNNFRSNSRGSSYRRGSKPSSKQDVRSILSRLPISIYQESSCTVRLALGNDDDNNNNNESSVVAPQTTISSDTVERRF